ncbi:hypothetical protein AB6A23_13690 [Paenibacillus tarimensis]
MIKLILPVVISLVLSLFYILKFNNIQKSITIISIGTVINMVCLLLGTFWFWSTVSDGIAQGIQSVIYGICFGVILLINVIAVIVLKKRKIS